MSIYQKDIISRLLKEKGKTKRELAVYIGIHENGINRLIGNNKISIERLEQIARFLDMNVIDLFDKIYLQSFQEPTGYISRVREKSYSDIEEVILLLSEIIKGQKALRELEESNAEKLEKVINVIYSI